MCGHAHGAVGLDKLQSFIGSEGIGDARVGGPSELISYRAWPRCVVGWLRVLTLISNQLRDSLSLELTRTSRSDSPEQDSESQGDVRFGATAQHSAGLGCPTGR